MINICTRINCLRRFSIGSENDKDVSAVFCPECQKLYYYSERKTRYLLLCIKYFCLAVLILFSIYFFKDYIKNLLKSDPKENETSITSVFSDNIGSFSSGEYVKSNQIFHPYILDSEMDFNIDFGNGQKFENSYPDSVVYTIPGNYDIIYNSDGNLDTLEVIVIPKLTEDTDPPETVIKPTAKVPIVPKKETPKEIEKTILPTIKIYDCPFLKANFGTNCNDGNAETKNDVVGLDCNCKGISKDKVKWYSDLDGDGMGDPNPSTVIKVIKGEKLPSGKWVDNGDDSCPMRSGNNNGCPELIINPINSDILIDKEIELSANPSGLLASDIIIWSSDSSIEFLSNNNRSVNMKCRTVGKYKVKYKVENASSPIGMYAEQVIEVKISKDQLRDIIQPIVVQGASKGAGNFEQQSKAAMESLFKHTLSKRITVFDEDGIDRGPLDTFLTSDVKLGLPTNKHDLKVIDISYDRDSGQISELYIKFI